MRACVEEVNHHPAEQCVPKEKEKDEKAFSNVGGYLCSVPFFLRVRTAMSRLQTHTRDKEVLALI